ncbi:hypothetical protein AD933_07230 [Acetobacter malorum]|uniref:Uncharacterized protein n=1 Tax=Acetobacter malorum TaxID=178901 RepID=A0A149RPF7_9PROT|nr:hypothetical protein [Acetobacter malorum]KXV16164.1 hypothetical protein AD933_07230 [Acetobacter malorum]
MSEMLIDELVVRLGLDTTSLQSEAKQTTQLLDKLRQSAEQTATSTRQASTQATSALARMRGEAVRLLAVLSGGRGLNRLLADLSTPAGQTTPRTSRSASTGIPSLSAHATRETRAARTDRNPTAQGALFPFSRRGGSANSSRSSHSATSSGPSITRSMGTFAGAPTGASHLSRFGTLRTDVFSGLAALAVTSTGPFSGSPAAAFFTRMPGAPHAFASGHSAAKGALAARPASSPSHIIQRIEQAFPNTGFPFRNQTGQGRLSHRAQRSAATTAQITLPSTAHSAQMLQNHTPKNPLMRPFVRSHTVQKNVEKRTLPQAFSAPMPHRTSFLGTPLSSSRTQAEQTVSTALTQLITQAAHRATRSPTTHPTGQRDVSHAFPSPADPRGSRTSLKLSLARPAAGYPAARSLTIPISSLSPNHTVTGQTPLRSPHTDALTAQTRTLSRTLATLHVHAGRALAVQPYLPGSPLLHAAASQSTSHLTSTPRPTTTTHIGPVTITVPSGNPQAIAQALQGLGGGDSHTLTSLATIGTV